MINLRNNQLTRHFVCFAFNVSEGSALLQIEVISNKATISIQWRDKSSGDIMVGEQA